MEDLLRNYLVAELYTDRQGRKSKAIDEENNKLLNEKYGAALPLYVLFTSEGKEIARIGGRPSVEEFAAFLNMGLVREGAGIPPRNP